MHLAGCCSPFSPFGSLPHPDIPNRRRQFAVVLIGIKPLHRPGESKGDVVKLAVPVLGMQQVDRRGFLRVIACEQVGVIGAVLQFAALAEAREVQPSIPDTSIFGAGAKGEMSVVGSSLSFGRISFDSRSRSCFNRPQGAPTK